MAIHSLVSNRKQSRILVVVLAMVGAINGASGDAIDEYIKTERERLHIPEVVVGVVKNGQVIRSDAIGFSDVDAKTPATLDDAFEIGSLTKQFTAMGVMMLVENGRIDLEDPVSKYLPDVPKAWSAIKIRNLLYQNSGLPEYSFIPKLSLVAHFDRTQFMAAVQGLTVDFAPGDAWAYSNTNYALLGWIIESAAGEPFSQFMTDNIIRPLGMTHTRFLYESKPNEKLTKGYIMRRDTLALAPKTGGGTLSDGGLVTNLPDLIKWDAALSSLRLLSRASYQSIWTRGKLNSGRVHPYGMGWNLSMPFTTAYMGHGGNSSGFSCGISRYPKSRLTVIVLTNLYRVGGEAMAKEIAQRVDPTAQVAPFVVIDDPDPNRTGRVKLALNALAWHKPDESLLETELVAPMKTERGRRAGAGVWLPLQTIDEITLGDVHPQGSDTSFTYRIKADGRYFIVVVLWSPQNKLAQANLYNANMPEKLATAGSGGGRLPEMHRFQPQ